MVFVLLCFFCCLLIVFFQFAFFLLCVWFSAVAAFSSEDESIQEVHRGAPIITVSKKLAHICQHKVRSRRAFISSLKEEDQNPAAPEALTALNYTTDALL